MSRQESATNEAEAPRRHRTPQPARAQRPLVRQHGAPSSFRLEFDLRTTYDFLISMLPPEHERDVLPGDERWLTGARASLDEADRSALDMSFGSAGRGLGVQSIALHRPEIKTARDLVELVDRIQPRDYVRAVLADQALDPEAASLAERALAGDRTALRALPRRLPEWLARPATQMIRHPDESVARLRRAMHAWLPKFEEVEARVRGVLDRDLELRAVDRQRLTTDELIETTTGGLRVMPDPRVQRVVLAPSYFSRPYNEVESGPGWRLFCYPVADAALPGGDEAGPPSAVLRLFRALGDASRLRILRLLADRDLYLTEIAQAVELSKPTTKHHLAILRAAGLVTVVQEANLTYYSLRRERLQEAGSELRAYLG